VPVNRRLAVRLRCRIRAWAGGILSTNPVDNSVAIEVAAVVLLREFYIFVKLLIF
jgi:hypothetical protein